MYIAWKNNGTKQNDYDIVLGESKGKYDIKLPNKPSGVK